MPACPAGSVQQQVMQQYSYLFQMAQQLNLALERLEQGTGASSGGKGTEQQYRKLRSLIAGGEERLKRAVEELAAQVETEYVAADSFEGQAAALSGRLEAEPEKLGAYYGFVATLRNGLAAVADAFDRYRENAAACVRMGVVGYDGTAPVYGTAVGFGLACRDADGETEVEPNGFRAVFTGEELSLRQDAQEVARVADGRLHVNGMAALGGADVGGWRMEDNGDGLAIRWIGGREMSAAQRSSRTVSMAGFELTARDAVIGQSGTLTVVKPGNGYTFRFSYAFGGASGTLESGDVRQVSHAAGRAVYRWRVPEELAQQIPDALRGTGTMSMAVYSGAEQVGSVQTAFTVYVPPSMAPTASVQVSAVSDNTAVSGWGVCVQGLSRVQYTVTAAGAGGASVQACRFTCGGQTVAGLSGKTAPIAAAGTLIPSAVVTDSRGRSVTAESEAVTVYAYHRPTLAAEVIRCKAGGTAAEDGAYLKVTGTASCASVGGRNTVQVRVRWRPAGGSWSGYTTLVSGAETVVGGGLAADAAYETEVSAVDTAGGVRTVRQLLPPVSPVTLHLHSGGRGAAFGKRSTGEALECAWPAVFYGNVEVSGGLTLGGQTLTDALWPVGCVRLTAEDTEPQPSPEGAEWERVDCGMAGIYAWRRIT